MEPSGSSSANTPKAASVRVRRSTTVSASRSPFAAIAEGVPALPPTPSGALPTASALDSSTNPGPYVGSPTRRRRGATITERLFSTEPAYVPLAGQEGGAIRSRSSSTASAGSGPARSVPPVVIHYRGRSDSAIAGVDKAAPVQGTVADHHAEDEVDLLEVLDQSVGTTAHLSNITTMFIPSFMTRKPVCDLEAPTPPAELEPVPSPAKTEGHDEVVEEEDEDEEEENEADPLDKHLAKMLKKQKRKETARQVARGIWTFLKTPLGIFFGVYGILVVFWGAALVLVLVGAVPMSSYNKTLWVEIASQILTALFTITSLLPLPWRMVDAYHISVILSLARTTYKRRKKLGLPPLRDPNDLPDPPEVEYWVGPGGEKLTGPRPAPTTAPLPVKKRKGAGAPLVSETPEDRALELTAIESRIQSHSSGVEGEPEAVVLTDTEQEKLRQSQIKFSRSQTWFRAHTTPTHHAFPLSSALWISLFMVGNSIFQIFLCGVMWGMDRFERPPWTTGCLIPLSFGCGIAAAVLIWRCSERTKRKAEVTRKVWKMLKKDEEALNQRRKEAAERRAAVKAQKKLHLPHH